MPDTNDALADMKDALTLWVLPNGDTILKLVSTSRFLPFGDTAYILQPKILRPGNEIVELVRKSELDAAEQRIETLRADDHAASLYVEHLRKVSEWLLAEARWVATEPTVIHHHDIEKHAESYNEGYADAERQATEPVQGYDEPDATNPDHLRFAADVIEQLGGRQPIKGSSAVQVRACTPNDLRDVAERIATRDLVEDITAMWADLPPHPSDLDRAAILVSQFDVTRKAGA